MSIQIKRLNDALELVQKAMCSPNAFENAKESTFSALRRGCLDLRKDILLLDSDDFSTDKIRDAWLFLIELSRAKLRRKHVLESINIMLQSPKWGAVFRNDPDIQAKLPDLSNDMQLALGYIEKSSPLVKSVLVPSSATIQPSGIVRKGSGIIPLARSKSMKTKKPPSARQTPSLVIPRVTSADENLNASEEPLPLIESVVQSASNPPVTHEHSIEESNPFRKDLNPFKDYRGLKQTSNPYARASRGSRWWETPAPCSGNVWWS